jgi:SAM-dependent methyltransferase
MVRKALERLIVKTRDLVYDLRHRVRTRGVVPVAQLGLTRDSIQYEGIAPKTLRKALASLGPLDGYTFVDLGSGMGRAVLVASEFPFRRIVGVEIAPELHAIAGRNVRRYRGRQQCRDVQLVQLDALRYDPPSEATVFFFNFPFREAFMTTVVGNIERSLGRHPRRAFLVFVNPETAHVVDRSPAFEPFITDKYFRIWRNTSAENAKGVT